MPIFAHIHLFLNEIALGILCHKMQTLSVSPVAMGKVAWNAFIILVCIDSWGALIEAYAAEYLVFFDQVTHSFIHNVFVSYIYIIWAFNVLSSPYLDGLFVLVLSLSYRQSVNTDGVIISDFFTGTVFGLTATTTKRPDFLVSTYVKGFRRFFESIFLANRRGRLCRK